MLVCVLFLLGGGLNVFAQQMLDSEVMIGVTPALPAKMDIPEQAQKVLLQKLRQVSTQNGFGSFSGDFVLTANPLLTNKSVAEIIPPQTLIELEISIYLLNIQEQIIVDEIAISGKGLNSNETRAFIQAIQVVNPRSPAVRTFMKGCREKITAYYTTRVPALLAKAQSLAEREQYQEALAVLSSVPESVDEYSAVAEQMVAIYLKEIDKKASGILQGVKAALATKDYEKALELLLQIDPSSTYFKEASTLIDSVKANIDAQEKAELEERQRALDDRMKLEKMRLEAAQKMGASYAQETEKAAIEEKLTDWFLGKFK